MEKKEKYQYFLAEKKKHLILSYDKVIERKGMYWEIGHILRTAEGFEKCRQNGDRVGIQQKDLIKSTGSLLENERRYILYNQALLKFNTFERSWRRGHSGENVCAYFFGGGLFFFFFCNLILNFFLLFLLPFLAHLVCWAI